MKALLQRVSEAQAMIGDRSVGTIGKGILVFICVERGDTDRDRDYISNKIVNLRIFEDSGGKMNLSVRDAGGEILVVSQFTLAADCRKGNRPSFDNAEEPEKAKKIYLDIVERLRQEGMPTSTGEFASNMQIHLVNDGPVTFLLDSRVASPKSVL
jgi:D-tyrosyl-tRNA(Tyr) deacylase